MRQVSLDTETTGLRIEDGHRIIEIACVELIDRKITGKHFHQYINPEREIEAGAIAVHGITNEFLRDKPLFSIISEELMEFIVGSELIIHNAAFDIGFINFEFSLAKLRWKALADHCQVTDTLQIARKLHVGQRNSLDALCKRYGIDNSKREMHGALLDAQLLAQVYLAMTGGQGNFFDTLNDNLSVAINEEMIKESINHSYQLEVLKASAEELDEHEAYLKLMKKQGKCLWLDEKIN